MVRVTANRWFTMIKNNWLIPVGMVATVGVFCNGMKHLYRQDSMKQNHMMRARIGFQFLTLFSMVGGMAYHSYRSSQKNKE